LALTSLFFCLLLRESSWDLDAAFRLSIETVIALLWGAPLLVRLAKGARAWIATTVVLWSSIAPIAALTFLPALARLLGAG
jgi:hypothetical protein